MNDHAVNQAPQKTNEKSKKDEDSILKVLEELDKLPSLEEYERNQDEYGTDLTAWTNNASWSKSGH
jgi:cell fate (sporulation/competence/biofilm development) regulator YmcA (YheA/YmcA/DUF963 family)